MMSPLPAVRAILSRRFELVRLRWKIRGYGSPKLNRAEAAMRRLTDTPRIERLAAEVAEERRENPVSAAKYTDFRYWQRLNVERAGRLGLHAAPPMRILDIGCGPGYFLTVAHALGHESHGVDVPQECFSPLERRVYGELLSAQRLSDRTSPLRIDPFVALPRRLEDLELITAFWICFNRHRQPDEWGAAEWRFFVEDARQRLRRGGRLYLELNENRERYGALRFYDAATLAYFNSVGAARGARVIIPA
jgi:SAM-dependent methyltransferase